MKVALSACVLAATALAAPVARAETMPELVATIDVTFSSEVTVFGGSAYVASASEISVISTTTNTVTDRIAITATSPRGAVAIGDRVYFADSSANRLIILNTQTRGVSYFATTGCTAPTSLLALSAAQLVVNCHTSSNVQIINVSGPSIASTVTTGSGPRGMSASGNLVFVPNSGANSVSIVNASTGTATTVAVGSQPEWTAFAGGKIFVANFAGNTVSILNGTAPYSVITTVAVGNNPQGIYPCAANVFTANRWTGNTSVINPSSNSVINTITLSTVGAITHVMGVNNDYAYFLNFDRSSLSVVNCQTRTLLTNVTISPNPQSIAFSSAYAYVAGVNKVSVVSLPDGAAAIPEDVSQRPPDWIKQVGRAPGESCEPDWNPSWAEWPNGGTGGFVCVQVLTWSHRMQTYVIQGA